MPRRKPWRNPLGDGHGASDLRRTMQPSHSRYAVGRERPEPAPDGSACATTWRSNSTVCPVWHGAEMTGLTSFRVSKTTALWPGQHALPSRSTPRNAAAGVKERQAEGATQGVRLLSCRPQEGTAFRAVQILRLPCRSNMTASFAPDEPECVILVHQEMKTHLHMKL